MRGNFQINFQLPWNDLSRTKKHVTCFLLTCTILFNGVFLHFIQNCKFSLFSSGEQRCDKSDLSFLFGMFLDWLILHSSIQISNYKTHAFWLIISWRSGILILIGTLCFHSLSVTADFAVNIGLQLLLNSLGILLFHYCIFITTIFAIRITL